MDLTTKHARGKAHHAWRGDSVGYNALHTWISRNFGKPEICEFCKKDGLTGYAIHWANKSGQYLRKRSDWIRLCVSCHKKFDMTEETKAKISRSKSGVPNPLRWKPLLQTSVAGEVVATYKNLKEACQSMGVSKTSINNNVKNRSKTAGGFIWAYL